MEKNKPIFTRSVGSLRVSVFENLSEGVPWWNVAVNRRWRDASTGEWREAGTFNGLGDLAQAAEAVRLAQSFIVRRQDELMISE